jgi:hypothetical protein
MPKHFFAFLLLSCVSLSSAAQTQGAIADLAWMTGGWEGPIGPGQTLEENWIKPTGGSIASLVRVTGNGKTPMVELIVIEEENDSLVLRIQQWDPGFKPRSAEPQTMTLTDIGENRVSFLAASEGGMKTLGYSSPEAGAFNIDIESSDGKKFTIKLKAR